MSAESNQAAVRAVFDAIVRRDRAALLARLRPDARWSVPKGAIPPFGGVHCGAETIAAGMLGAVDAAFVPGTQRIEIRLMLAEGEVVMAETRMTAERAGGGPPYDNAYVFVFEFSGDRIAEIREHVDTRYAAEAFAPGARPAAEE
jgi:ketosteroid isomerase-like protein